MSEQIIPKRCTHCKQSKTLSDFSRDKSRKDGLNNWCKQCRNQYGEIYYLEHKPGLQQYKKQYNKEHKPEKHQYNKQYRQEHRLKLVQRDKQYYKTLQGYLRSIYHAMRYRCNNPKNRAYKNYGGRGIKVKFDCFNDFFDYVVKELEVDPRGLTIDRIDNDGNYERGNIRFVTQAVNNQNQRLMR